MTRPNYCPQSSLTLNKRRKTTVNYKRKKSLLLKFLVITNTVLLFQIQFLHSPNCSLYEVYKILTFRSSERPSQIYTKKRGHLIFLYIKPSGLRTVGHSMELGELFILLPIFSFYLMVPLSIVVSTTPTFTLFVIPPCTIVSTGQSKYLTHKLFPYLILQNSQNPR